MASGTWSTYKASAFAGGSGTSSSPYQIATAAQLAYFAYLITNSNSSYADKYYKLTANIDLSAHYWNPIGNASNKFKGYFDGNGKTISYMISTILKSDSNYCAGLFSHTRYAYIYNLRMIYPSFSDTATVCAGVVAAKSEFTEFKNIIVYGSYQSSGLYLVNADNDGQYRYDRWIGGIVGNCSGGSIQHCDVRINDCFGVPDTKVGVGTSISGNHCYIGGIAGEIDFGSGTNTLPTIAYCNVYLSNIRSLGTNLVNYIGGLAGMIRSNTRQSYVDIHHISIYMNCHVNQNNWSNTYIGGLGYIYNSNFNKQPLHDIVINKCYLYKYDADSSTSTQVSATNYNTLYRWYSYSSDSFDTQFTCSNIFWNSANCSHTYPLTFMTAFNGSEQIDGISFSTRTWTLAQQNHAIAEQLGSPWTVYLSGVYYVHNNTSSVIDYKVLDSSQYPMYILHFEDTDGGFLADTPQYTIYVCSTNGNFTLPSARSGYTASVQPYLITGSNGYTTNASDRSIISGTEYSADQTISLSSNLIMVVSANIAKLFQYKKTSTSTIVNVEKIYYKNANGNVVLVTEPFYKLSGSVQ